MRLESDTCGQCCLRLDQLDAAPLSKRSSARWTWCLLREARYVLHNLRRVVPPMLGKHTSAVLEELGYSAADRRQLCGAGVVRGGTG